MVIKILLGVIIGGVIGAVLGYFGKCSSGSCPLTANPFRGGIYGAVVGALLASAFSTLPKDKPAPSEDEPSPARVTMPEPDDEGAATSTGSDNSGVIQIDSKSDFDARVLNASGIYLVDLFSDRCPPCRMLAPTISSLAKRYAGEVTVCKVNLDHSQVIAALYSVRAIPTVLIFKDGKEVKRLVGLRPESEYARQLDELIR